MRILRLTNSSDVQDSIPVALRATTISDEIVRLRTGEPVETIVRAFWPNDELPAVVDRWISRYEPDLLFVRASAYWCSYESLPLRLQHRLGPLGRLLGGAGLKAGGGSLARWRAFQLARRQLVRALGGDVHFHPDEVTAVVERTFRRAARHESLVMAMRGPGFPRDVTESKRGRRRASARNDALDDSLSAMCSRLHIAYAPHPREVELAQLGADRFHTGVAGQRVQGSLEGELIARAWLAARNA